MAQQTHIKVSSVWKPLYQIWTKVSGVWKEQVVSFIKVGGSWKQCMNYIPPAPVALAASDESSSGFWANHENSAYATGYYIDISLTNTFATFIAGYENKDIGDFVTEIVEGLNPSTSYFYRWRAYNTFGTSGNSDYIEAITTA